MNNLQQLVNSGFDKLVVSIAVVIMAVEHTEVATVQDNIIVLVIVTMALFQKFN